MRGALISVLFLSVVAAQDSGLVLRTFVGYNQMANTLSLTPEKKAEVAAIGKQAMAASGAGNYSEALKLLHRGTALMRGIEWTPAMSVASSLTPVIDHAVWAPGQGIRLQWKKYYPADPGAPDAIKGELRMRPVRGGDAVRIGEIAGDSIAFQVPDVAAGAYRLEVVVPPLAQSKNLEVAVAPGIAKQAAELRSRVSKLKSTEGAGLWTVRYLAELFDRADRSEISPHLDWSKELRYAESLAASLEKGVDPFEGRTGDLRRAYLSKVDQTLQPYRVYIPTKYANDKPTALVVALHGMGGDENTLLDRYGSNMLKDMAEKYGWIVVTPKGREPASMYRGAAEQDVLDVLAQVRSSWNIDENRIYVTGHSMGGFGSWSIAMNHPEIFAALGPVAGGGNPSGMAKIRHIPQIVVHGDNDRTVNVSSSRNMVEAGKVAGAEVKYIEVPGGGHNEVFMPAMPQVFEFFAAHAKKPRAAAAASGQ